MTGELKVDAMKVLELGKFLDNCRYLEGARKSAAEWINALAYKIMKASEKIDAETDGYHKSRIWELSEKLFEYAYEIAEFDPGE